MNNVSKNNNLNIQDNMQNNTQAEIKFLNDMHTLIINLSGIDKNLQGYGYKYQNYNEIAKEIKNVIKNHNLDICLWQYPTSKYVDGQKEHVIRTTFFSKSTGYRESFDTPMFTENLQFNDNDDENSTKVTNTVYHRFGSAITYTKRYALASFLMVESEMDTDADPNYNNYENKNYMPNKQISVNQKREQKKEINYNQKDNIKQEQKKDRFYYYSIFKDALSNIKNWVNSSTTKDNINSIIQKISFIQNIDPNNIDDIKKIEADLISYFEKNSDFKSINYWAEIIKDYFKRNNRLKDLQDFEKFMSFKQPIYGASPLIFFSVLKKDKQFDYIFAA
ncbi:ERF family protein [Borreliella japonica]|uniref:ERF family protein n=1 Tax=Borreliella japonica TaxID=34095 RepID=UPI003AF18490